MNLEFDEQGFAEFGSALIDMHKTMNFSAKLPKTMELVAVGRGLDGVDWLSSFMSVRTMLGIEFDKGFPCMPAPDKQGRGCKSFCQGVEVTVTSSEAVPVPASGSGGRSVGNCESGNLVSSSPWDLISTVSDPQALQDGHSVPKNSPAASDEAVSVKSDATDPPKDELLSPWGSPVACDGAISVKSDDTDPPSPDFPGGVIDLNQSTEPESFGGVGLVSQDISEVNPDDGATSDGDTSSESSSSESSQEDEPEPRLMHPPAPPEGTFFVQHRKLRTLHLLLEGHRSFTLCGRPTLKSTAV
eukprot:s9269_g2.t1